MQILRYKQLEFLSLGTAVYPLPVSAILATVDAAAAATIHQIKSNQINWLKRKKSYIVCGVLSVLVSISVYVYFVLIDFEIMIWKNKMILKLSEKYDDNFEIIWK